MSHSQRVPLYQQIREYMLDHIRQKKWKPNERIPSENELASAFNVSRITVKNALSKLIEDGLVYQVQGKGSFISPDPAGEPVIYHSIEKKRKIAFLMPRLDNLFTANILSGIESEITKHGYSLLFFKTHDSLEIEKKILLEVMKDEVTGIIIYPVAGENYNEEILKFTLNHFPLVVVDRYIRGVETNCVCSDNVGGAFQATNHLIELGHSKIGFVSTFHHFTSSMEDRLIGYEKALAQHNIPIDHRLQYLQLDMNRLNSKLKEGIIEETSKQEIISFLRLNPSMTAIFAANSAIGLAIIEVATELGLSVPEDLSIIFFDDYEASAFSRIPPTCVSQQEYNLGQEAAKLLISVIQNPGQERRKMVMETQLIERKSTCPCKALE